MRRLGGSLAHHVNNALTGVIGYLELALRQAPPGPIQEHVRSSLACAYQAAETVRRIVAFTRGAQGNQAQQPLPLAELARELAEGLAAPGVTFVLPDQAETPTLVRAAPALLAGALEAVLRNAIEAMPDGGTVRVWVEEQGGQCRLCVRDNGPGLCPLARANLFEPFFTTKGTNHLGLGLAMARELVEAQGGALMVESASGQGTMVTLSMPALSAEVPGRAAPAVNTAPYLLPAPHMALGGHVLCQR